MNNLPAHGQITCNDCFGSTKIKFDETRHTEGNWRITANPLAWGNQNAEIVVLGFSKGPTQIGALSNKVHNDIAYDGGRSRIGKIFVHLGLLEEKDDRELEKEVTSLISDTNGRFHFGSLVRCTVEQYDTKSNVWIASGGGMLDKFVKTNFGGKVSNACSSKFLSSLPTQTKLVIMFGMGSKLNYVSEVYKLFQQVRPGDWDRLNDISYTDGNITVVHVDHFAPGNGHLSNWLGKNDNKRL